MSMQARWLLALLVTLAAVMGLPVHAGAADTSLAAIFAPNSVDVATGRTGTSVLRLSAADSAVSDIELTLHYGDGIEATAGAAPTDLAVNGSAAIVVTVRRLPGSPASAALQAVLKYKSGGVASAAVAALSVTTPAPGAAAVGPITVETLIGTGTLIEYQSTDLVFHLTNTSDRTQEITSIVAGFPDYLDATQVGSSNQATGGRLEIAGVDQLNAGDGAVVQLHIKADKPVQPADALVVVTVAAQDTKPRSVDTPRG